MKIHFCDLCNESVPQSDLDEGRAFLRKGRVVCARCDRSMSHESAPEATPGGPFDRAAPAAGGSPGAAQAVVARPGAGTGRGAEPTRPAPISFGSAPYQVAVAPPPPRARSGAGAGLALIALLFTGALAFWINGRLASLEAELRGRADRLEDAQFDARASFEQALQRSEQDAQELGQGLRTEVREMRDWLNAELAEGQQQARDVRARIDDFGQRIEAMSESFGNVKRHDQELIHLQQRYTALNEAVDQLAKGPAAPAGAGRTPAEAEGSAAPSEPAPAAPPPWMGLVEQLSSPNTSERWQAVVALGETRDPAVSEFLIPSLSDEDIFIRMVAARVLGDLGAPIGIPALIEALDDPESAVREAAYIALKAVTKRDLPFDPVTEDASDRARRIKAWRDWWEKEAPRFVE